MKKKILIYNCDFDIGRLNTALAIKKLMRNFNVSIVTPYKNEFPSDISNYNAFIITGSRANVDDKDAWIKRLAIELRKIKVLKLPILGICFGHQMIANTLGGKVVRAKKQEFGYTKIKLTRHGIVNPLFKNVTKSFPTFEVHNYVVTKVPFGAKVLARNEHAIQSYALRNFLGIQFHPEIDYNAAKIIAKRGGKNLKATKEFLKKEKKINEKILLNFGSIVNYWKQ